MHSILPTARFDHRYSTHDADLTPDFLDVNTSSHDGCPSTIPADTELQDTRMSSASAGALNELACTENEPFMHLSMTSTASSTSIPSMPVLLDANGHRQKRRRLDDEEPATLSDEPSLTEDTAKTKTSWFSRLQNVSKARASKSTPLPLNDGDEEEKNLETTRPKRHGTPSKTTLSVVVDEQSRLSSDSETTPRRRTLRLCTGGKLAGLPGTSAPRGTELSETETTKPSAGIKSVKNLAFKHGKIIQTFVVVINYKTQGPVAPDLGQRIQAILDAPRPLSSVRSHGCPSSDSVHPFFAGIKLTDKVPDPKGPVPWKDIVFRSHRPETMQQMTLQKPVWPPLWAQHVGRTTDLTCVSKKASRLGKRIIVVTPSSLKPGDFLNQFRSHQPRALLQSEEPRRCLKLQASQQQMLSRLDIEYRGASLHQATRVVRSKALRDVNAFNRGLPAGPYSWPQQFAPSTWQEVLQPECQRLFEWLGSLAVHHVRSGVDSPHEPSTKRRRKFKKHSDDLNDFIVHDQEDLPPSKHKTAIVLSGPPGCGKTASVYAVAKQLGFEVFEIHAGMRRNQKDILDKVGDMAQNHLVQRNRGASLESSPQPETAPLTMNEDENLQPSLKSYFSGNANQRDAPTAIDAKRSRPEQKQSLILFEEVDNLFEDDRGFWNAVQTLIASSKRPIILTCNNTRNVPIQELDIHTVLRYKPAPTDIVVQHLRYISIAEGHIIEPAALKALYLSKNNDLRASITELDFWCQMGIGSVKGGLDWFPDFASRDSQAHSRDGPCIYSQDSYREGLDLLPVDQYSAIDILQWMRCSLGVNSDDLIQLSLEASFSQHLDFLEDRSFGDATSKEVTDLVCAYQNPDFDVAQQQVEDIIQRQTSQGPISSADLFKCLDPLIEGPNVFPTMQGRLAPSLDSSSRSVITDIAPYVRSIAAFDQRLEQQRNEFSSSQGKQQRNTRAARAAAEGGDKSTTRRDKWFSDKLDLDAVMHTGGHWLRNIESSDELSSQRPKLSYL